MQRGTLMNNVEIWLWILLVMLPHNSRTAELLNTYGSALEAAKAMRDGECTFLTPQEKQRVERTRTREVRALINECNRLGIRIVTLDDDEYPVLLKAIPDPPIVLFVKGSLAPLNDLPSLAVVGPRSPSEYGRNATDRICTELAKDGIALVSGLAVGVDSVAHRCAVNNGGYTVGVLGCGMMVNYPAENEELKITIIEKGGAIISELLPYTSVSAGYFKFRNRIISGMCLGSLVTEASSRSGSLLTAEHSSAQRRAVFAVPPHDIFAERFSGVFDLFRNGAIPVFDVTDIYSALSAAAPTSDNYHAAKRLSQLSTKRPDIQVKPAPKRTPKQTAPAPVAETTQPDPRPTLDLSALSPEEASIVTQLYERPLTMDELIELTGISHDKICAIILGLELSDVITRNQTGTFSIV
ncbi:MAG: DNA-protecting protein DprA [Ruminococcaceae bacterium]|nr:DNA-protecting protein DprA [Oscillospiraceae bacterium]